LCSISLEVLQKTKNRTTIPGYIHKGIKVSNTYMPMFIAALFRIAKLWRQPRCPLMDELIKNM
jgi:hypothetical protein